MRGQFIQLESSLFCIILQTEFPIKQKLIFHCVISGFRHTADENCAVLGYSTLRRLRNNPEECNSFVFSLFQTKVFFQFVSMNLTGFVYELL